MVEELLASVLGENFRKSRFPKPPAGTYAVWMDDIDTDGPDCAAPCIFTHNITIEVYEPRPDDAIETAIEAAMKIREIRWRKQDRYWIQSEQMYQTVYEFSYIEKE